MDKKHESHVKSFNDFMTTVTDSEKRIDRDVSHLKDRMDKTKSSVDNFNRNIKATINETIKDFGNKSRADAAIF